MNKIKKTQIIKKICICLGIGTIAGILIFVILEATLTNLSSPEYCKSCHEMRPAYESWKRSPHYDNKIGYAVNCQSCHLPSKEKHYFQYSAMKIYKSIKDICKHYFGKKYDSKLLYTTVMLNMPNSRCICCHNNLLADSKRSANPIIQQAHKAAIENPNNIENRCIRCHKFVGHKRLQQK